MTQGSDRAAGIRILLGLGETPRDPELFQWAARLAAEFQAELAALFVEDADLIKLSGLPFARELGGHSAAERPLDPVRMERALQAEARRAERFLTQAAQSRSVRFSFHVCRGRVVRETMAYAETVDLLMFGQPRRRVAFTPDASPPRPRSKNSPIAVVYDGSAAADRALTAALRLAKAEHAPTVVLLPAGGRNGNDALRERARMAAGNRRGNMRFRPLRGLGADVLVAALSIEEPRLLLLPDRQGLLAEDALESLLSRARCPVCVTR